MDVLDLLDDGTLESHSRGPGFESLCAHKKSNQPPSVMREAGCLEKGSRCCEYDGQDAMVHSRSREFESLSAAQCVNKIACRTYIRECFWGKKPEQNILLEIQRTGVMLMQCSDGTAL
jgi:hypothetical protein